MMEESKQEELYYLLRDAWDDGDYSKFFNTMNKNDLCMDVRPGEITDKDGDTVFVLYEEQRGDFFGYRALSLLEEFYKYYNKHE